MCFIPSSSLSGQFSEHVFKALQLDSRSPEDPAIVQPCVTVLQKLNNQFYSGLTKEAQVILAQPSMMVLVLQQLLFRLVGFQKEQLIATTLSSMP
ncbi:hypothetical protein V6N13_059931 [Hibiscus sabdariffa]|uniref:Uncharacterized protein n=1 Tax=Hibiscus sabdariffa TaxID=183260 RepID=A0ABR2GBH1_9ROSI